MMLQKVYYYNNSVTYNGSLWVLDGVAVGASVVAGTEPKDGSTVWTKQVSKAASTNAGDITGRGKICGCDRCNCPIDED